MAELIELIKRVPLRHATLVLSRINMVMRYAMQEQKRPNMGKVQEILIAGHMDDELLGLLKQRFPTAKCDERPIFLPHCVLNVLRLVVTHCDPEPLPKEEDDEFIRYTIGRACLMVNNLLLTPEESQALLTGTEDDRRIELMVQIMASFELTNSPKVEHLAPRLQIMYRMLLKDHGVKSRIASRCENFNFEEEFNVLIGLPLERWLFVIFAIYAYYLNGANALEPNPEYMLIDPLVFRGESGITQKELDIVLSTISIPLADLKTAISNEKSTDPRYDFVSFRSRPLFKVDENRLFPADLAFVIEKCHTGMQWAMHDLLPIKRRHTVFTAWGLLFEEYVHWLLEGMQTKLPGKYIRSPKWRGSEEESFDGIIVKGNVLMPAEYKGGFLPRNARYAGDSKVFLHELDKKFTPGCDQLADKIGALFAENDMTRKELEDVTLDHIRSIVPVLVLQDHIFRVPFLNWYMNKRFQKRLSQHQIRTGVVVCPLTVVNIHDLESIVHSTEAEDFDFVYALHHRTIRDPEVASDLLEILQTFESFGRKPSPRIVKVLEELQDKIGSYLFPNNNDASVVI